MKIISKFRDYYDPIAHMYGGGDPKIRYERDKINNSRIELAAHLAPKFPRYYIPHYINLAYLVINGKYLILCQNTRNLVYDWKLATKELIEEWDFPKWLEKNKYWDRFEDGLIEGGERLVDLSRKVGNPIFVINDIEDRKLKDGKKIFHIWKRNVPLCQYGVQDYYPAEQIYQDLSYFVANVINESPDVQPAGKPPQTDKEKILAHGMDLRYSFRHR